MGKHRLYSEKVGPVTVTITPSHDAQDLRECGVKIPVRVRVSQGRKTWKPREPMCVAPLDRRDPSTRRGSRLAAEDALAFFEAEGSPLSGGRRRGSR